jgi:hypothetical protein
MQLRIGVTFIGATIIILPHTIIHILITIPGQ